MNSPTIIEPLNHTHRLTITGRFEYCHEVLVIQQCCDSNCGYWNDYKIKRTDTTKCEMLITKFSTKVCCYSCKHCGRSKIDT